MISKEQLKASMPYATAANIERFIGPINETLEKYEINTSHRIAAFLAQIAHESGCLKYTLELADGKAYEGRKDLGNVNPGDGVRFKGRGLIQITGRSNYEALSKRMGIDFIAQPELLEGPVYASLSAGDFWKQKNLNIFADYSVSNGTIEFLTISKRINGINKKTGFPNGWDDRLKYWALAKKALGIV